jgi:hypothetical protein
LDAGSDIFLEDISKKHLRPDGFVVGRFKMLIRHRSLADSAFSPANASPSNLITIFEIPSINAGQFILQERR